MDTICLETRDDLVKFLKENKKEYVILKFSASWCRPCQQIAPFMKEQIKSMNDKYSHLFDYVEVDVDECFDLYAFLKQKKMIKGIPTIFLYAKKIYSGYDTDKYYIPQASISGTNQNEIQKVLNLVN
jgi:thiol-disulfide isomerase/thioredoxin